MHAHIHSQAPVHAPNPTYYRQSNVIAVISSSPSSARAVILLTPRFPCPMVCDAAPVGDQSFAPPPPLAPAPAPPTTGGGSRSRLDRCTESQSPSRFCVERSSVEATCGCVFVHRRGASHVCQSRVPVTCVQNFCLLSPTPIPPAVRQTGTQL